MYDAKNIREIKTTLPTDSIFDGVIIYKEDGKVSDFLTEESRKEWSGETNKPAVNFTIEVVNGSCSIKFKQMFTYLTDGNQTVFSSSSNLGKYYAKYGKLPDVGDKVIIITNEKGFGKIKLK